MRITLLNRIARWVTVRSRRAAPPGIRSPDVLNPAQIKRLVTRLRDLEWQVRGLSEQCSTLKETVSVHDWSLEALWEQVYEPRTPSAPCSSPYPPPPKKTLN
jgi:hypothetical protein